MFAPIILRVVIWSCKVLLPTNVWYVSSSLFRAQTLSRHGQAPHPVFRPAEWSAWQEPSLFLWSLPMDSVVQLLNNLQFWNPEQTEVGVSYVGFLRALRHLWQQELATSSVPHWTMGKQCISKWERMNLDGIWGLFTWGWSGVYFYSLHKIEEFQEI